jgi:hypothetical protein
MITQLITLFYGPHLARGITTKGLYKDN